MQCNVQTLFVQPALPPAFARLKDLASNLYWTWNAPAREAFMRLDRDLWTACYHNPVLMLNQISQQRLDAAAHDPGLVAHVTRVIEEFDAYMKAPTWFSTTHGSMPPTTRFAYFSFEYGMAESLPIYSGGLGVLSGDHMKSASDLGLPLVGIGLLYRQGYFRQSLTPDGWQQESYPDNDFFALPVSIEKDAAGKPVRAKLTLHGRDVQIQVWRCQVGRVPLYLLDTDVAENHPDDRGITARLYGGDHHHRVRQEMVLGVGGMKALAALGIQVAVAHMNEGHAAFCVFERVRQLVSGNDLLVSEAFEAARSTNVFTTHTPVPAGNDVFHPSLVEPALESYLHQWGRREALGLGRINPQDDNEGFGMTVLALKSAQFNNGVSELHGHVSRNMWQEVYRNIPANEIPITHITNGIHVGTWASPEIALLFDRYLGPDWLSATGHQRVWNRLAEIPDAELWRTHERNRERLVAWARRRLARQLTRRNAPPAEIHRAEGVLDPEALTIGFARRFATYKRATLFLRDVDRLLRLLNNKDRPLQLIVAGKAHPHDHQGKEYIQAIARVAQQPDFFGKIVFIEDYDMNVARYLVQGVDVWLNNPRRPYEASGTSGMKVCVNGGLNMSVLDGWWCEGYNGQNGWAIGDGREYADAEYQDRLEAESIYALLEREVLPMFYDRSADGTPKRWVQWMRNSMQTCVPVFNTHRMVQEYAEKFYVPAWQRWQKLTDGKFAKARKLAAWKNTVVQKWDAVRIEQVLADAPADLRVGSKVAVKALVRLGDLTPDDVQVDVYTGEVDTANQFKPGSESFPMAKGQKLPDGRYEFKGEIVCKSSGRVGYACRIVPQNADQSAGSRLLLTKWN